MHTGLILMFMCKKHIQKYNLFDFRLLNQAARFTCITHHRGFATVCLDHFLLKTACRGYRLDYGHLDKTNDV